MIGVFRIEIHDPSKIKTPALNILRVVFLKTTAFPEQIQDFPLDEVPDLIAVLLAKHEFEHARNFANAWFVGMAHLHGNWHVELT